MLTSRRTRVCVENGGVYWYEGTWLMVLIKIKFAKVAFFTLYLIVMMIQNCCKKLPGFKHEHDLTKLRKEKRKLELMLEQQTCHQSDIENPQLLEELR